MDEPSIAPPDPTGASTARDAHYFVPPSAAIQEHLNRALKGGDTFALFDAHGDALGAMHGPEGIYFRDTRHLSYWRMTICGNYPMLLGSGIEDQVDALVVDLTNPDITRDDGSILPNDVIYINRTKFLNDDRAHERLVIRNFDDRPHRIQLEFTVGADFLDMFEVRGDRREKRGQKLASECRTDGVVHRYVGLDDIQRQTKITFVPSPRTVTEHRICFEFDLAPGQREVIYVMICFDESQSGESPRRAFLESYRRVRETRRAQKQVQPRLSSSNSIFDAIVTRSVSDLAKLVTETGDGPVAYAGIPWYCTLFGRDSLITALQTLWYDPSLAKGTLTRLAALQADKDDPLADAEPGKILHETRACEMANTGEIPFGLYYGSVDSTPLFVYLAGEYFSRTGDEATIDRLWPNIKAALAWLDNSGDRDGDGFLEYGARTGEGLRNQGWKDSHDAISHADGRLADGPIAIVEMQAYAYGAWMAAASLAEARGENSPANEWRDRASEMRRRFDEIFFDKELGTYILALDGEKKPCRVVASNAGHALLTGIALPERAEAVARRLMAPDCFSGWGIRTLSQGEKRYNPMSYHNGSIWPHDNALIAAGFARYGLQDQACRVFEALYDAGVFFEEHRYPELFCGFTRRQGRGPILYPVACAPQAWSSVVPLSLIQTTLGMDLFHPDQVAFANPRMPAFLHTLSIAGLSFADRSVDLDIRQLGDATSVFAGNRTGNVEVNIST